MCTKQFIVRVTVMMLSLFILGSSVARAGDLMARDSSEFQRESTANDLARAFVSCLDDPKLADSVYAAIGEQIASSRAVAFINGYWVKPINLSAIYVKSGIVAAMTEKLSGNAAALDMLSDAVAETEQGSLIHPDVGAGMIFIPHEVATAEGLMDLAGLTDEIGSGAFLDDLQGIMDLGANDFWLPIFTSGLSKIVVEAIAEANENGESPESDGEGSDSVNWSDSDDDNDGVPDDEDAHPFDPESSITHCPPPGVCFSVVGAYSPDLSTSLGLLAAQAFGELVSSARLQSVQSGSEYGMVFAFPKL